MLAFKHSFFFLTLPNTHNSLIESEQTLKLANLRNKKGTYFGIFLISLGY